MLLPEGAQEALLFPASLKACNSPYSPVAGALLSANRIRGSSSGVRRPDDSEEIEEACECVGVEAVLGEERIEDHHDPETERGDVTVVVLGWSFGAG